jgi:hypothetical protein
MAQFSKTPVQASPVQRAIAGKPADANGMNPSIITGSAGATPSMFDYLGMPFADSGSVAPSFIFPPLPFADESAE